MNGRSIAHVITNPMISANRSAEVTLSKFLRVIRSCFDRISVVGGNIALEGDLNDMKVQSYRIERAENRLKRLWDIAALQLKMAGAVLRGVRRGERVFFWVGDKMIIPYFAAKVKRASIHYFVYGNVAKEGRRTLFTSVSAKLIRFMANHAAFVCVESPSVLQDWDGLIAGRVKTIHLYSEGIGMNGLEERTNTIGMVCRLTEAKHVVESIEAFVRLHEVFPDWRCEIIGSGKQYEACAQAIEALNASEYVRLLGWIGRGQMRAVTRKWKYLLFPTDAEGLPNGLIEMMGQGIPAIASPIGGIRDVVTHGENGWTLRGVTARDILRGLTKALRSEDYIRVAQAAHGRIMAEYSLEAARRRAAEALNEPNTGVTDDGDLDLGNRGADSFPGGARQSEDPI